MHTVEFRSMLASYPSVSMLRDEGEKRGNCSNITIFDNELIHGETFLGHNWHYPMLYSAKGRGHTPVFSIFRSRPSANP